MCAPAAVLVPALITAAATTATMVEANQQTQHAKGAAEAAATQQAQAQKDAAKTGPAQTSPVVQDQSAQIIAANKKRQQALAAGMMSTFGPGANLPQPPSLVSTPQAFATGMKTALGQ